MQSHFKTITFRVAEHKDVKLLYDWANDSDTRKNSFNQKSISYNEHLNWFTNKINDNKNLILIFLIENVAFGQVRFEPYDEKSHYVSISVSKEFRGKGFATTILEKGIAFFFKKTKNINLRAEIRKSNSKSVLIFENTGFRFKNYLKKKDALIYEKTSN